jgi:hypothetical protein
MNDAEIAPNRPKPKRPVIIAMPRDSVRRSHSGIVPMWPSVLSTGYHSGTSEFDKAASKSQLMASRQIHPK